MDRRIAIKNLALVLGGATLFGSDILAADKPQLSLKNIQISAAQAKLLADIAETIIPKTTTPGAKDLNLPTFILLMVDDCYNKTDQQAFVAGLNQFTSLAAKKSARPFALWPKAQREAFLLSIEAKNGLPEELNRFYRITKDKTVQGYTQSQYFMTKQVVYELIPGRYIVDVPVKKASSTIKQHG